MYDYSVVQVFQFKLDLQFDTKKGQNKFLNIKLEPKKKFLKQIFLQKKNPKEILHKKVG